MRKNNYRLFLYHIKSNIMRKMGRGLSNVIRLIYIYMFAVNNLLKYIAIRKKVYKSLTYEGVQKIKLYKWTSWKNSVYYFTGVKDDVSVFVKTNGVVNSIKQEKYAINYITNHSEYLRKHIPYLYYSEEFIVEKMLNGTSLDKLDNLPDCADIVQQLFDIYRELKRINVYHCDIHPGNFILKNDGTLVLIDFGFALVDDENIFKNIDCNELTKKIIKGLGGEYAPNNGTVDDAYSMLLTMKYVCPSLMHNHYDIWRKMNEDIGKRVINL